MQYWKKRFNFVMPKQIFLGVSETGKKCYAQMVSVRESLKLLLEDPKVKECVINSFKQSKNPNILRDFCDGNAFARHQENCHQGGKCIHILLFQDAFDSNAFSSGGVKPNGFYYTVGNLPPEYRSKVNLIQLAYMVLEKDFKPSRSEELNDCDKLKLVLKPLIMELKDLQENGIKFNGEVLPVCVIFLIGDSLGQHVVGGFVKSFSSAQFSCRFCTMSKTEFQENPNMIGNLRTPEEYDKHVSIAKEHWSSVRRDSLAARKKAREQAERRGDSTKIRKLQDPISKSAFQKLQAVHHLGVKYRPSPFNQLGPNFHIAGSQPSCIAHDFFLGIYQHLVPKILQHFVTTKGWFDFHTLNSRIRSFKCKGSDALDTPKPLKSLESLNGNAVSNWNLVRLLPFMISDLVIDKEDPHWHLFLQLKEITEYVCAPAITMDQVAYLDDLISEFLLEVKNLFPSCLTPKLHFLCHYPSQILEFGPLIRLFTLRYESKHTFFKRVIKSCNNYKNVTKTLVKKYMCRYAYDLSSEIIPEDIVFDSPCIFSEDSLSEDMLKAFPNGFSFDKTVEVTEVVIFGTSYRTELVLLLESPSATTLKVGCIKKLLVHKSKKPFFLVEEYLASTLDTGLYTCEASAKKYHLKQISEFGDHYPLPLYLFQGKLCFTLKHTAPCMMDD
ncbi:MAP kinase-activated protein kinase 3 [Frankliniella fusca]|uniref:MAP kinase-activated protein kinase 3 n=1 Tax=Frankliniella fusca TaxID=407009 RepID=A0AAE1H717_9NEOP|nr:MAP kinase-activated protein kinase 3 [Frankliniella fusca]